jgi:pyruvate dehydrogenase E1 component alpha subunit
MAAAYQLPVIFVCENNFYASHMPLLARRAADNLVQSAAAHGLPGECIDGNDVTRVLEATTQAVERARSGSGPTLLECRTYRWRGHVGASWDEDVGVKRKDELRDWLPKDPIKRLRDALAAAGSSPTWFEGVDREVHEEIAGAIAFARSSPLPDASELLRHIFV